MPQTLRDMTGLLNSLVDALEGLDEAYCRAGSPLNSQERVGDRKRLLAAREALAAAKNALASVTPQQRDAAIDEKLAEYNYPANTRNAARAGWYACAQAYGIGKDTDNGQSNR